MSFDAYNKYWKQRQLQKHYKLKDPNRGLTVKMRKFCDHYLSTGNKEEAYSVAGYSPNSHKNYDLVKSVSVQRYLQDKRFEFEGIVKSNFEWTAKKLENVVDRCIGDDPDSVDVTYAKLGIEAIDRLIAMHGHKAPDRKEVEIKQSPYIKQINDFVDEILENDQHVIEYKKPTEECELQNL